MARNFPDPKANIGQYIIPPSELYRLNNKTTEDLGHTPPKKARSSRKVRSQSAPVEERMPSSQDEKRMPSLPLPPRRAGTTPREGSFPRDALPSPDIPSFSAEDTVNNFFPTPASLPLSEFGVRAQADAPPPRPKRSDRRTPANIDVPSHSASSSIAPHSLMTPRAHPHPHVTVTVDVMRRPSTSAVSYASTSRQASASTSSSSPSSLSQKRSPLTFRELESPRHALTEKEKADKWEDLLARSAQAGGTLHIGDLGLPSEHLDVSDASAHDSDSYPR
ncbi:hypothetical protein A0H81_13198 [Grifola frondosa]|uniref:Uncharacterized protein n=1 Tax=Grifola frondosa TaxID=5627 RepID=A0A1C7LRP3_GRIFR|nr:hypothetical protein A0H81_13198 [Grifola frondosa]